MKNYQTCRKRSKRRSRSWRRCRSSRIRNNQTIQTTLMMIRKVLWIFIVKDLSSQIKMRIKVFWTWLKLSWKSTDSSTHRIRMITIHPSRTLYSSRVSSRSLKLKLQSRLVSQNISGMISANAYMRSCISNSLLGYNNLVHSKRMNVWEIPTSTSFTWFLNLG